MKECECVCVCGVCEGACVREGVRVRESASITQNTGTKCNLDAVSEKCLHVLEAAEKVPELLKRWLFVRATMQIVSMPEATRGEQADGATRGLEEERKQETKWQRELRAYNTCV